jgi:hypothetical protein
MLLYPLQEAIDLLSGKLASAKKNLSETIEDLEWLREQATVMEVNFARVHNVRFRFLFSLSSTQLPPLPFECRICPQSDDLNEELGLIHSGTSSAVERRKRGVKRRKKRTMRRSRYDIRLYLDRHQARLPGQPRGEYTQLDVRRIAMPYTVRMP